MRTRREFKTTPSVFLIGLRGSGKSAVGSMLAATLKCPCFDTDAEIEGDCNRTIEAIFRDDGEEKFREIERESIARLVKKIGSWKRPGTCSAVVSLGGGAVLCDSTRQLVREAGWVVLLDADNARLVDRLRRQKTTHRPPLTGQNLEDEVARLRTERFPVYSGCADCRIDTSSLQPEQVAEKIAATLSRADS